MDGILVIDKPKGITSHGVVSKIRRHVGMKRVGHAGTLDPDATGVLVLCLGNATKISSCLMQGDKTYRVGFRLGVMTDTYDSTGNILVENEVSVESEKLLAEIEALKRKTLQAPPPYSAVKVKGKKLYMYARQGTKVEAPLREIHVSEFSLRRFDGQEGEVEIGCSKGTFVRSLIHDLGKALGCGGMTTFIRRTRSGHLSLDQAHSLEELLNKDPESSQFRDCLLSISQATPHIPQLKISNEQPIIQLRHGISLTSSQVKEGLWKHHAGKDGETCLIIDHEEEAVALVVLQPDLSIRISRVI